MATTSRHQQLADMEAKSVNQLEQIDKIQIPKDILTDEINNKPQEVYNVIFRLVKKRKGRTHLDNCCDNVINPKTKRPERIYLLAGAKSIWEDDLENILKDKNRYERGRVGRDIVFHDGVLRVRSTDTLMLEFLRANTHNVGESRIGAGMFDYYEYNPKVEQELRHKKQLFKIEMVGKAKDMKLEDANKLAAFFGIPLQDELGMPKGEGIKTELMLKADSDPTTFAKYIDSAEVEISYLVKRAILDSKIEHDVQTNNITWTGGGGFIAKLPMGRKAYEYLTELAMTNSDEGKKFKEQLSKTAK